MYFDKRERNRGITPTIIGKVSELYYFEAFSRKQEQRRGLSPIIVVEVSELDFLNSRVKYSSTLRIFRDFSLLYGYKNVFDSLIDVSLLTKGYIYIYIYSINNAGECSKMLYKIVVLVSFD